MRKTIVIMLSLFFLSQTVHSAEEECPDTTIYELRIGTGVRGMLIGKIPFYPGTMAHITSIDIGDFFRFQWDVSPVSLSRSFRMSISSGVSFKVYGKKSPRRGGLEIVIPAMIEAGIFYGNNMEVGDSHREDIRWFVVGPSSGADLTWWSVKKVGFNVSLKASYLFRSVDMNSTYDGDYKDLYQDRNSFPDVALTFGVAL